MRRISSAAIFVATLLFIFLSFVIPFSSLAVDCNRPPVGSGGSWARKYKSWCESCGGTYNSSNQSCSPGSNWGGGSSYQSHSYDYEAERRRQEEERLRREEAERQRQREIEEERKREEEEARKRQEEFDKRKQEALKSMKGITEGELGLKDADAGGFGLKEMGDSGAGGLGLKGIAESTPGLLLKDSSVEDLRDAGSVKEAGMNAVVTEPPEQKMRQDIEAAGKRIPELRKDIRGLQALLKQFGASQRGNVSEFGKWQDTFQEAAENSRKNAVEYGLSMFLQYNLMGSLEASVKKDVFGKLDGLINSSDPATRRWLGEQMKKRNVELALLKDVVTAGTLAGDFEALRSGDQKDEGKALDTLLFVNDLLEAKKIVSWSGSQYFQQAKMIGETYTDLAAFGYSAVNVRKVEKATDAYNREIRRLSWKLESTVKEMNCLERCLDSYTDHCLDRCTGKTRFGSPPPEPRGGKP